MTETFQNSMNTKFAANDLDYTVEIDLDTESYYIRDEHGTRINTIPILEYEERLLSPNDSQCFISLSLCFYGQRSEIVRIPSSSLFKSNVYLNKFGGIPFAGFEKDEWGMFYDIIQMMLPEIEQREIYTYSGWTKSMDQCLYGSLLVSQGCTTAVNSSLFKNSILLSNESPSKVCDQVNYIFSQLIKKPVLGYSLLMYLMLGCTKPRTIITKREGPEFVTEIVGLTGSRKTSVACAIYNTINGPISSFEDTLASIRREVQGNQVGVTVVDDYKNRSPKNDEKFEKLVRLIGDINTTGKYVSGNKVVDELVSGLAVVTGEQRPLLQQSSYARILFVDLDSAPVSLEVLTLLQEKSDVLNSFIVLFLQYILEDDLFDDRLVTLVKDYRDELRSNTMYQSMHGRYYGIVAWMEAIWDLYLELMQQHGCQVEFDFKEEIKQLVYQQHCHYDDDPVKLFRIGYQELQEANELVILNEREVYDVNFDVIDYPGELFIKSNGVYKKICKYWKDKGIDFPCSERKLRQLLLENGILVSHQGKTTREKKTKDNRSFSGYTLLKYLFIYN